MVAARSRKSHREEDYATRFDSAEYHRRLNFAAHRFQGARVLWISICVYTGDNHRASRSLRCY